MCGIIAVYRDNQSISEGELLDAMHVLGHRGPDGQGHWINDKGTVALGHRRLAIVDIDNGKQPISNEDNSCQIIVNGAFYGFRKIRRDLELRGHKFKTDSDSEIALHLYEEYDLDFVKHLSGEFSIIIWDQRKERLIAVRDRFGIKPLQYHYQHGNLHIASEAKALFSLGIKAEWDHESLTFATKLQYLPADKTLFKNIYQLKPGHMLIKDHNDLKIQKYWDLDYPADGDYIDLPEHEIAEQVFELLDQAVSNRLDSDRPSAFHLSGGIDSTIILAVHPSH
ncbi:MAG: asparagine synthetase B [Lentisphaeria bacterium]|nr:asparagine synthetase B [Lentisphaeria bacterium]